MEVDAETLFDYLGKRYEDAFADSPNLCNFLQLAVQRLPKKSKVLDFGCGTGRPVAHIIASAGHEVHGIDISQEMVRIASSQVPGTFEKADMRKYQPQGTFDAVFVILSLFQITPGETYSMCYKCAEWLKPGGYVLIGITPSTSLRPNDFTYDATWDCARQMKKPWMDKCTNETFFSEERWRILLQSAGFDVESEVRYTFTPNDPDHQSSEIHHLFLAKKVEEQPLLGPYPLFPIDSSWTPTPARGYFTEHLVSKDLDALFPRFEDERVLSLGHFKKDVSVPKKVQTFDGPIETLPFESQTFDVVVAYWKLDTVLDIKAALREITRVTDRTSKSRIMIIQGAPENEFVNFCNTTPSVAKVNHQGQILQIAGGYLKDQGFRDISLRRIDGKYVFQEQAISERCKSAANLINVGPFRKENVEELNSRLQLHFLGSEHEIGGQMVLLEAKLFPK